MPWILSIITLVTHYGYYFFNFSSYRHLSLVFCHFISKINKGSIFLYFVYNYIYCRFSSQVNAVASGEGGRGEGGSISRLTSHCVASRTIYRHFVHVCTQNVSKFLNDRSKTDRINPKLREGSERRISFLNFARSLNGLSFEQKRTESDQTHLMIEAKINRFNSSEPNKLKSCAQIKLVKRTFFYSKFASHLLALAQADQLIRCT